MRVHAGLSAALRAALPQRAKWPTVSYKPECTAAAAALNVT